MNRKTRLFLAVPCILLCMISAGCGLFVHEIREGEIVAPTPRDHFVKVGEINCHYTEYPADGKDLLLLHGFASSTYTWDKAAPLLNKMGYHVWALDLKGFGWSDKPEDAAYDPLTLTEEVSQWMDAAGLKDAVCVGNSLGGGIAVFMAILHPEKVDRLVLVDAATYNTKLPFIMKMASMPLSAEMTKLFFSRWMIRLTLSEVYHDGGRVTDDQVEAYYDRLRTKNALNAQIAVVRSLDFARFEKYVNRIPEIEARSLIIWGDDDRWIPVSSAYRLNKEIRGSTLAIVPDCGHLPQEEHPEITARLIDAFIRDMPVEQITGSLPLRTGCSCR